MTLRPLMPERPCGHCGKSFRPRKDLTKNGRGIFCSTFCAGQARRQPFTVADEEIRRLYSDEKLSTKQIAGRLSVGWKPVWNRLKEMGVPMRPGGWRQTSTYESCMGLNGKRTYKHRVSAEQKYGRALKKGEVVHHIDGNRQNNNPENLSVMTRSRHNQVHKALERMGLRLLLAGLVEFSDVNGYTFSSEMEGVLHGKENNQ